MSSLYKSPSLEQIKAHQETSNNSIKSLDSSKSTIEESQENSEEEQNSETEQKSDIKPRLIQRISYQGYMLEYLDLMEKRMAALSQSTNGTSFIKQLLKDPLPQA